MNRIGRDSLNEFCIAITNRIPEIGTPKIPKMKKGFKGLPLI